MYQLFTCNIIIIYIVTLVIVLKQLDPWTIFSIKKENSIPKIIIFAKLE